MEVIIYWFPKGELPRRGGASHVFRRITTSRSGLVYLSFGLFSTRFWAVFTLFFMPRPFHLIGSLAGQIERHQLVPEYALMAGA